MPRVSSSPKPWRQFTVLTRFLRVPRADWTAVKIGSKSEFRARDRAVTLAYTVVTPTPVVAYSIDRLGRYESALMVLEETWKEPLGAIGPESLKREGFPDIAHFRRYWMARNDRRRFRPLDEVQVYRVRPWREGDLEEQGVWLLKQLYREHIPGLEFEDELR